ncbi:MAG: hypothetical protein AUJ98_11470 [Bacteroidetes bacterium CG2_30_33_31]|nr:MAG: hypothetical protein AUJ98_11470 [Bacteroidetes bacterium CG2_30_33_31]
MIFVTGGTGMLGSNLLALLVESAEVVALKRVGSNIKLVENLFSRRFVEPQNYLKKIHWVEGDILDSYFLEQNIETDAEVYHCAAFVSFQKKDAKKVREINVEGTKNIVNICLQNKIRKLCYVSSIAALGRVDSESETSEKDYRNSSKGSSVYSASKYEAEMEVWRGIAEGLNAVIVNPSVILGAGDWNKGSAEMITTVYNGLKFFTKGTNGYVDVADVAKAMLVLMKSEINAERFILSSENITYYSLFSSIAKNLGVAEPAYYASPFLSSIAWRLLALISYITDKEPIITKETAKSANAFYKYSSQKMMERTGFKFMPIEESIKKYCQQFLEDKQSSISK